jgi:hypothetical protein
MLYVADTATTRCAASTCARGDIDTLCGNGKRGTPKEGPVRDPRACRSTRRAPWRRLNDQLHIALTGDNQIWSYDLGARR